MKAFILKGNICYSKNKDEILCFKDSYLVCADEKSEGVFEQIPEEYKGAPVIDFKDRIIIPGMCDLHLHAPQFPVRGLGTDMELLDWLEHYIFSEESKYADLKYAELAYSQFVEHLRKSTTTRASVFATIHTQSTSLLMDKLEESGLITYVGKVNMDRNSPEYLCEKSSSISLAETQKWIEKTVDKYKNTKPIITPRFVPSCSNELLRGLGELARKFDLPVQSHLSENLKEIDLVQQLCPQSKFYGGVYNQFGLFGGGQKCIMAHCVYSSDEEIELMKNNGVFIAHSPESNINLGSGVAPVNKYLDAGLRVGLSTDLAAGSSENMFKAITYAVQASKLRWRLKDETVKPLTFQRAFYLATMGSGEFFGKVGSFEKGYEFDAVVLDDENISHPQELNVIQRLERIAYLSDDRNIYAKFVAGNRIF